MVLGKLFSISLQDSILIEEFIKISNLQENCDNNLYQIQNKQYILQIIVE